MEDQAGLSQDQIMMVVNDYIGVTWGYLGDFTHRTHVDFYLEYCDLECKTNEISGTTRERFIEILRKAPPAGQAKILRGVIERFPVGSGPATRTDGLKAEISGWADAIESRSPNPSAEINSRKAVVERVLAESEALIKTSGEAISVDWIHAAFQGYLEEICTTEAGLDFPDGSGVSAFLKVLREKHPKFKVVESQPKEISKTLKLAEAMIKVLDSVRKNSSLVEPNQAFLSPAEAMLYVNLTRSMFRYISDKVS